jgi:hypothetical protein
MNSLEKRLEQYTLQHPEEVLIVYANIDGEPDQIAIFKGFSSSLMRPPAFDPDVPVLPDTAEILSIDRLESPYQPESPRYIQAGITGKKMQAFLAQL